jgi:hypothetical protein
MSFLLLHGSEAVFDDELRTRKILPRIEAVVAAIAVLFLNKEQQHVLFSFGFSSIFGKIFFRFCSSIF